MITSPFQYVKKSDPVSNDPQHAALVKQTEKWVAQSFYGTLLKQMRNDPFRSTLMDGGRGGQAFGEMFDQQIADRMSKKVAPGLVRAIVKKIEGPRTAAAASYKSHSKNAAAHPHRTFTAPAPHPRPTVAGGAMPTHANAAAMAKARLHRLSGTSSHPPAKFARFHVTTP
jgi:Rod binding domain-containing protein